MTVLRYKGYTASVDVDLNVNVLVGRVQDIRTIIVFEAEKVSDLRHAFEEAITDYLDDCAESGIQPEKPRSGNILVRTTPELHLQVAVAAQHAGVPINTWIENTLREALTPKSLNSMVGITSHSA